MCVPREQIQEQTIHQVTTRTNPNLPTTTKHRLKSHVIQDSRDSLIRAIFVALGVCSCFFHPSWGVEIGTVDTALDTSTVSSSISGTFLHNDTYDYGEHQHGDVNDDGDEGKDDDDDDDDDVPYNEVLFAGTHNSAINLKFKGLRGFNFFSSFSRSIRGRYDGEAHRPYQHFVLAQRLSIRDQLDQGIRVLHLEVAALTSRWQCRDDYRDNATAVTGKGWREMNHRAEKDSSMKKNQNTTTAFEGTRPTRYSTKLIRGYGKDDIDDSPLTYTNETNIPNAGLPCEERLISFHRCFDHCPFVISHGTLTEDIGYMLGYSYPEDVFRPIADFVRDNPREIVTLALLASHGDAFPNVDDVMAKMDYAGLLQFVWNPEPNDIDASATGRTFSRYPTLGEMRRARRTVLVVNGYGDPNWGPRTELSMVNATGVTGNMLQKCEDDTPCLEGWDAMDVVMLAPSNAVMKKEDEERDNEISMVKEDDLRDADNGERRDEDYAWKIFVAKPSHSVAASHQYLQLPQVEPLFVLSNLSSRRGRFVMRSDYFPFSPMNAIGDFPYLAGGNPMQSTVVSHYSHIVALEKAWSAKLVRKNQNNRIERKGENDMKRKTPKHVNWILVDFFNTTVLNGGYKLFDRLSLVPNEHDGLVKAVRDINTARSRRRRQMRETMT